VARIALLFSGQPRQWNQCFRSHLSLFPNHETDVFFHFWEPIAADEKRQIVTAYRPKAYLFEPPVDFSSWQPKFGRLGREKSLPRLLSKYYSWKQVASLVEHSQRQYDCLVQLRTDLMFPHPLNNLLYQVRPNSLLASKNESNVINDTFVLGGSVPILYLLSLYDRVLDYIDRVGLDPARLLSHHLERNDVGIQLSPLALKMQVCGQAEVEIQNAESLEEYPAARIRDAVNLPTGADIVAEVKVSDLPEFATLAQFAQSRLLSQRPASLIFDELHVAFERELANVRVVSFDIFDTLLLRRVGHPVDVFLHLERQPAFALHKFSRPVAKLRSEAEKMARRHGHEKHGSGEVVLGEIYEAFCELVKLPESAAAEFVAAEESVELSLCRSNPRMQAFFRRAADSGKQLVALSDTYHRADHLVHLLEAVGTPLPKSAIFASSEWRVNKQSGKLFGKVFDALHIAPSELLHIGDHPISDYQMPRKLGVKGLLHGHHGGGNSPSSEDARLHSLFLAQRLYSAKCGDNAKQFWWLLGHNTFGPLIVGYCLWLRQMLQADRIDRAYFLLRDGEIFHRVFETLFPDRTGLPSLQQLPSSRRAYVFPLLDMAPDFVIPNLLACTGKRPAGEYLSRLGLPVIDFAADFLASGFRSSEETVDASKDSRIKALFERPRVRDAMRWQANLEKDFLVGFLRQQGVLSPGRIAMIDLGWNGSLQKATHLLAQSLSAETQVFGYYLATFPDFRRSLPEDLKAKSYLNRLSELNPQVQPIYEHPQLLEIVCSNATGSLHHFADKGVQYCPVALANPSSGDQLKALYEIHDGIIAFAKEFRSLPLDLAADTMPPTLAVKDLLRLLKTPTKEEAMQIGGLALSDDFGTNNIRWMARFRPSSSSPKSLWEDYQQAYWKPGMLNQPSAQGSALQTLWWLMER
jgi:FMN phosphatase YigB (HAD superfamily)